MLIRQHLGIVLVLIALALAGSLAWVCIERSVPGYRTRAEPSPARAVELL